MSSARALLKEHLQKEEFDCYSGSRAGISLSVVWPDSDKRVIFPYIHLLFIKRRSLEIALVYPFGEVHLKPHSNELCEKLLNAFREFKVDKVYHGRQIAVTVLLRPQEPDLELEEF